MAKGDYSKQNKCLDCGADISDRAERCNPCAAKGRKVRKTKKHKVTDNYSLGKKCPICGKPITNRAKRCKGCRRKRKKEKGTVLKWRETLLGNTEPPKPSDPLTPCEICEKEPRTPDTWWCASCQEAIDAEYLERSLTRKVRRGEKERLAVAA